MSITKNLINYLYEEEQIDTNSIAKSIFDSLYDKEAGKFTKDPSQDIAKLCNNNQHIIHYFVFLIILCRIILIQVLVLFRIVGIIINTIHDTS